MNICIGHIFEGDKDRCVSGLSAVIFFTVRKFHVLSDLIEAARLIWCYDTLVVFKTNCCVSTREPLFRNCLVLSANVVSNKAS